MRLAIAEDLSGLFSSAVSERDLFQALGVATRRLGFDHFALSYDARSGPAQSPSLLIHDYPDAWARHYVAFDLGRRDPVRRTCERSITGFEWGEIGRYIALTRGDRQMLSIGRESGIADGFTVPRHLPGESVGSCTFAVRPNTILPRPMFHVAEIVGAMALASARRIDGLAAARSRPGLSERQRECVMWAARDKTAAQTAMLLGIGEETVVHHLKTARVRYDVSSRQSLILLTMFDGLIAFADILTWCGGS